MSEIIIKPKKHKWYSFDYIPAKSLSNTHVVGMTDMGYIHELVFEKGSWFYMTYKREGKADFEPVIGIVNEEKYNPFVKWMIIGN